jgi:hypothetical protein
MSDPRSLLERETRRFVQPDGAFERLEQRRDFKRRNQRIRAGVLGLAVAIAVGWIAVDAIRSTPIPADHRSEELGIFAPVADRIVYVNDGNDVGYAHGAWALDPNGPADPIDGPTVADDVASTLVPLDLEDVTLLGWSRDGTELLFKRTVELTTLCTQEYLVVLHADGTETRLTGEPTCFRDAAISPDGARVVFDVGGTLQVVDADGGQPVRLPVEGSSPTFSPDGTQIAYLAGGDDSEEHVWIANADGSDAHEILADEPTRLIGTSGLRWSPAGDQLALGIGGNKRSDALAIATFAPDGSDFASVITGGVSPFWSPDGSQIAYTILCGATPTDSCPEGSILRSQYDADPELFGGSAPGLAIADADGSNIRAFGFAASGPWHPGASAPTGGTR